MPQGHGGDTRDLNMTWYTNCYTMQIPKVPVVYSQPTVQPISTMYALISTKEGLHSLTWVCLQGYACPRLNNNPKYPDASTRP